MVNAVFRGGGVMGTFMLLLAVAPHLMYATVNLNLTLNMVLAPPRHQTNLKFGYSVAFWRTNGDMNLVVGAPLAPYEFNNTNYPVGNIFLCSLKARCEPFQKLHSDIETEALSLGNDYYQEMGMGIAETLAFTSPDDTSDSILLACAPRFARFVKPYIKSNPNTFMSRGACFRIKDIDSTPELIYPHETNFFGPFENKKNTELLTGYALTGYSAALQTDETVFMGCPNTFYGQGSLASTNYGSRRQPYLYNKKARSTLMRKDYNREGWALTVGQFSGNADMDFIATSIPNAENNYGQIRFFSKDLKTEQKPRFEDTSTHGFSNLYGYSLASGDLDQDESEDLIVGIPLARGRNGLVEGGKVFVYYAPLNNRVQRKTQILEGLTAWSRFGSAVVSDDFNRDGYYDVAVGAPYSEKGWGGAVYIYLGSRDGLCESSGGICSAPDMLLCASDFISPGSGLSAGVSLQFLNTATSKKCKVESSSPLISLGYSLAIADVDDNGYPDLLIGAPKADKALLIRSAPVVMLEGDIFFEPSQVLLGNKNCTVTILKVEENVVCFKLKISLHYEAHQLDLSTLGVTYRIELDNKVANKRIFFSHNTESIMEWNAFIRKSVSTNSTELEVYVKPGDIDTVKEITAMVTVNLNDRQQTRTRKQNMDPVPPVLYKAEYVFSKHGYLQCEDPTTCFSTPNLKISVPKSMAIMANGKSFKVHANISVVDDYALGFNLNITHPKVLNPNTRVLLKLTQIVHGNEFQGGSKTMIRKVERINDSMHKIIFEERIKNNTLVSIELEFQYQPDALMMYLLDLAASKFELDFSVNTTADTDPSDNKATLTIEADTDINLNINSYLINETNHINPKLVWSISQIEKAFNNSDITVSEDFLGPNIEYKIVIKNNGPAFMYQAQVIFELPKSIDGFPLFYMTEQPMAEGAPVDCDPIETNPKNFNFKIEKRDDELELTQNEIPESDEENEDIHERKKRMADYYKSSPTKASQGNSSSMDNSYSSKIDCDNEEVDCQSMRCNVSYLAPDKSVIITLKNSRILIASLIKFQPEVSEYQVVGQSKVITHKPGGGQRVSSDTFQTLITLTKESVPVGLADLPWWYLLLAILGGILLILLFSYCLYKCGFFKRNRPPTASGKESGSSQKIVQNDYPVLENTLLKGGVDNTASESTPLNQRKEMDNDATTLEMESTPLNQRKEKDNDAGSD